MKPDRIPELGSEDSGHEVPLLVEELLPFNSYWGRKDLFVFLKEYDFWKDNHTPGEVHTQEHLGNINCTTWVFLKKGQKVG